MTETVSEGDLVEAVKGETVFRGRVQLIKGMAILPIPCLAPESTTFLRNYELEGFTITVIEKAAPKIEAGFYTTTNWGGVAWEIRDQEPRVRCVSSGTDWVSSTAYEFTKWVRLEPRADTAKAIINRLERRTKGVASELVDIAAEYGVTL